MKQSILNTERNCWRINEVDHLAILFDGDEYYKAFFDVAKQARRSILIAGWEVDSRMGLAPVNKNFPDNLRDYFNELAKQKNSLKIKILSWKPSFFLAFGRERFARTKWNLNTLNRVSYINDKLPYVFSSFHEKMILIDNCCAFLGGMDLSRNRWDTSDHEVDNSLRTDALGKNYQPVHDLQFVMTGEIIASLRELIEKRLKSDSGLKKEPLSNVWPRTQSPQMRKTMLGISRTDPSGNFFEIENLYYDSIRNAQNYILIENQYLTHEGIGDLLCEKLSLKDGPEIIIILPYSYRGVFEKAIYVEGRNKIIKKLVAADKFKRLGVYYPSIPNEDDEMFIKVHSKFMAIDDDFLTLGSANLNYRSMLVDSEVNLSLESNGEEEIKKFIGQNVFALLSEHLDVETKTFSEEFSKERRLLPVINRFKGLSSRSLKNLPLIQLKFLEKCACLITSFVDIKYAVSKKVLILIFGLPLALWLILRNMNGF